MFFYFGALLKSVNQIEVHYFTISVQLLVRVKYGRLFSAFTALFCNLCSSCKCDFSAPLQIMFKYIIWECINALYMVNLVFFEITCFILLSMAMRGLMFCMTLFICSVQSSWSFISNPKYFILDILFKGWLSKIMSSFEIHIGAYKLISFFRRTLLFYYLGSFPKVLRLQVKQILVYSLIPLLESSVYVLVQLLMILSWNIRTTNLQKT